MAHNQYAAAAPGEPSEEIIEALNSSPHRWKLVSARWLQSAGLVVASVVLVAGTAFLASTGLSSKQQQTTMMTPSVQAIATFWNIEKIETPNLEGGYDSKWVQLVVPHAYGKTGRGFCTKLDDYHGKSNLCSQAGIGKTLNLCLFMSKESDGHMTCNHKCHNSITFASVKDLCRDHPECGDVELSGSRFFLMSTHGTRLCTPGTDGAQHAICKDHTLQFGGNADGSISCWFGGFDETCVRQLCEDSDVCAGYDVRFNELGKPTGIWLNSEFDRQDVYLGDPQDLDEGSNQPHHECWLRKEIAYDIFR